MRRSESLRDCWARIVLVAGSSAALALALSGCSSPSAGPRTTVTVTVPAPSPSPSRLLPGDDAPLDLAGVCAAESSIQTAMQYRHEYADRLTDAQGNAILGAVTAQYEDLKIGARNTAARASVTSVTTYLEHLHLKPGGKAFDPDAAGIAEPEGRITELCSSNETPVAIFASVGG